MFERRGEESRKSQLDVNQQKLHDRREHHDPNHPYLTCSLRSTHLLPFSRTHEHVSTLASLPLFCNQSRESSRESHLYSQKAVIDILPPSFLRDSWRTTTVVARGPSPSAEGRTRYGHTRCS